ncbi:SDR family NAD(P)-dependent oxidoreductase [Arthrobacter sp. KBS0702]|uniref:SDR family NAD(P)-dependent oxidoreductase n=1 Tax=Arthrobacter sp. KBS0702 TaxID=2578107 RepID=UPI00110E1F2B|nr:SDR family NAD(P)-dependent oxidoreductase [Arthrobacter sp. KBS0702]QDW29546.1 SDR family NAD(P)-dependent oxidoreductase [Arthrobacter sp. KBS0702]
MSGGHTLNILVAGGSSPSGIAVARALRGAGHRVFTVGSDAGRIAAAAADAGDGVVPLACDLADPDAVAALRADLAGRGVRLDGVMHLVGGWRGAKGIADQSDEDWDFLERNAVTTLRNVSRAFYDDLAASATGRLAMVSSTTAAAPTAGAASYAAAKAAAEAWTLAVADGFRREQSGHKEHPVEQHSAAAIFVVKALVDDAMRAAAPERKFPGYTDVADLGSAVVRLFDTPAGELNGQRLPLSR